MKRALILRGDNLGDAVLFSGALKHFRRIYPNYHITLAVKKAVMPLFSRCPYIDDLIAYERLSYPKLHPATRRTLIDGVLHRLANIGEVLGKEGARLLRLVFGVQYDVLICPVRSVTPDLLWVVKNCKAQTKIGVSGCNQNYAEYDELIARAHFTQLVTISAEDAWEHELITNMKFINELGAHVSALEDVWPEVWLADRRQNCYASEKELFVPNEFVCLAPFSTSPVKEVQPDVLVRTIPRLFRDVVIVGSDRERSRVTPVILALREAGFGCLDLVGKTSIESLVQIVRRSNCLVSVDNFVLHIGIALRVQTRGIVGGGHWGRFHPWGDPERNIVLNCVMDCFYCNWHCKYGDYRCVSNLQESLVSALYK